MGSSVTHFNLAYLENRHPTTEDLLWTQKINQGFLFISQNVSPIALVGAGGVGKKSVALIILRDDPTKVVWCQPSVHLL